MDIHLEGQLDQQGTSHGYPMDIHEPRYIIFQQSFNRTGNASEPFNEFPVEKGHPQKSTQLFHDCDRNDCAVGAVEEG